MHSNALLKWGVPALLVLALVLVIKPFGQAPAEPEGQTAAEARLTAEEARALGIDGDTPKDTVATLVGQTKAMRSELQTLLKTNEQLQVENQRLRERERNVDSRIRSALSSVTDQASEERRQAEEARKRAQDETQKTRGLLHQLQNQLSGLKGQAQELPVGFGLQPGDEQAFADRGGELVWVEPAGMAEDGKPLSGLPERFLDGDTVKRGREELEALAQGEHSATGRDARTDGAKPVYTIAQNSTLMGSVAMTALIGRVPIDGTVNDPYPFKVLIGPDNLAANGIELPEVVGAVASGSATGDWTLSCVRGQIESLTFVFADGTIRTLPTPQKLAGRTASAPRSGHRGRLRGGLGYLSDPYGVPCVSGERRSNAQQYIGSQSLITAAGAGVAALLNGEQRSTQVIGSGTAIGVSEGNSALHSILAGGVRDIREWVNQLYGEAFAAVYVRPAAQVAVHIDQELTLDYEPKGRKVNHELASTRTPDLD